MGGTFFVKTSNGVRVFFKSIISIYQIILSPDRGVLRRRVRTCRFFPSCSEYAAEAVALHGVLRGGWLGIRRLLRCHPWNAGGFDPVPATLDHERRRSRARAGRER